MSWMLRGSLKKILTNPTEAGSELSEGLCRGIFFRKKFLHKLCSRAKGIEVGRYLEPGGSNV